jgi:hypothetical protein
MGRNPQQIITPKVLLPITGLRLFFILDRILKLFSNQAIYRAYRR